MFKLLLLLVAITSVLGLPSSETFLPKKSETWIIGGHDADIADYPYQVAVTWFRSYWCGGSLIGPKWVLTSAFCTFYWKNPRHSAVIAGSSKLRGGQVVRIAAFHQHPQFNYDELDYDISVLKLAKRITIETASPIALHHAGYIAKEGANATITGWGGDSRSDVLQALVTKVVSNEVCSEGYKEITHRMMCTSSGEGFCGDRTSGGPLVVDGKLYGIASWVWVCGQYPSVNMRVTEETFREYVRKITGL